MELAEPPCVNRAKEMRQWRMRISFKPTNMPQWTKYKIAGNGTAKGQISERFERDVTRTLKGSEVTRNGSADNPAYLIKQEDGDEVLKLGSELSAQG